MKKTIKQLVNAFAVSGYEWNSDRGIAYTIQDLIGYCGERVGDNLVYRVGNGKKKIFISAHMDEVGFFITKIFSDYVKILPIGEIDVADLKGTRIEFINNGIIEVTDKILLAKDYSSLKVYGLKNPKIGDVGTFKKTIKVNATRITGPSLDNKVGCAALIELVKNQALLNNNATILICFSCREEVGVNGVMTAIKKYTPNICIDVDSAYAQPLTSDGTSYWQIPIIGKGPALQLIGSGFVLRLDDRKIIEAIAEKKNISLQYEIPEQKSGGTNARSLLTNGYETMQINVPVANQHSAKSTASFTDIAQTSSLLLNLLNII